MRTDLIDAQIRYYVRLGWSDPRIGRELGFSRQRVRKRRIAMGLGPVTAPKREQRDRDAEVYQRAEVYRRICIKQASEEIAQATGVALETIEKYRREIPKWWDKHYRRLRQEQITATDTN